MGKKFLAVVLTLAMVLSFAACGGNTNNGDSGEGETIVIKFAGTVNDEHPITKGEYKFAEILEEISGGTMVVENYPNCQLGSNRELYESVQNGSLQMAEAGAVILANFTDKFKFTQLPYLFNSAESVQAFLNGEVGQQMFEEMAAETGFRVLGCYENGWQAITNSKHEVKTAADLKGLKIRTQENDILLKIYGDLGCNPMLIAYTGGYDEVQDYCTDVNAVYDVASIAINEEFYQSLTDEQRGWIDQAVKESVEWQLQVSLDASKEAEEKLDFDIHYLTDDERQTFIDASEGVYDWFRENVNEPNLDKYLEEIDKINKMYDEGKLEAVTGNVIG